jgi:hypothetical protein
MLLPSSYNLNTMRRIRGLGLHCVVFCVGVVVVDVFDVEKSSDYMMESYVRVRQEKPSAVNGARQQ